MIFDNFHPEHLADLRKSGLTNDTIAQAGIQTVLPRDLSTLLGYAPHKLLSAYVIPYNGNSNGYSRFRCFYDSGQVEPRYRQRKESANHLYIPAGLDKTILSDPAKTLYVTEGEKKALKACQEGIPCVGLGGLWNWKDKTGKPIADLEAIAWTGREVFIVPDNDWKRPNRYGRAKNLKKAVGGLAKTLRERGATVKVVVLPESQEKMGLDDFLLSHTAEDFHKLTTADVRDDDEVEAKIDQLNELHAAVMVGGKFAILNEVWDPTFQRPDISFSSVQDFKNLYQPEKVFVPKGEGGKDGMQPVPLSKVWLESPNRRTYAGIVFDPANEHPGYYNLYRGFNLKPKAGDWGLIRDLYHRVWCSGNDDLFTWVMAWVADLFQNPGVERPGTSLVLRGKRGTGKGCGVRPLAEILGNHFLHIINQGQLTGRFNNHLKDALLVFADEAFWAGDKGGEGILKGIITEPTISVEPKGKDVFTVKNHVRLIVASNEDWVVPAGLEERRFCVLDVSDEHMQDSGYFGPVFKQILSGGAQAMLHDMLRLEISDVDLRQAPKTAALLEQIEFSMDTVTRFWFERIMDGTLSAEHGGWQEYVITEKFHADYVLFSNQLGKRHCLSNNAFSKKLRDLCPGMWRKQVPGEAYGTRKWALFFPPLETCRSEFEGQTRMEIDWKDAPA